MKTLIILSAVLIGVVIGIFVSIIAGILKRSCLKKRAKLSYVMTQNGYYKLTIGTNKNAGQFIIFKEKEELIKYLKRFPPNALIKYTKNDEILYSSVEDLISSNKPPKK